MPAPTPTPRDALLRLIREGALLSIDFFDGHPTRTPEILCWGDWTDPGEVVDYTGSPESEPVTIIWYQIMGDTDHGIHGHSVDRAEVEPIDGILTVLCGAHGALQVVISPMWTPESYALLNAFVSGPEDTFDYPLRGARYVPPL